MANLLPPPPTDNNPSSPSFRDWFYKIQQFIQNGLAPITNLGTGLIAKTGFNTFAAREIEGTTDRIDVVSGDGVAGNPTIDISPNYEIDSDHVIVESLSGATYTTLQDFINVMNSPGLITGGVLSDGGGGNLSVTAGTAMLRIADDDVSDLLFVNFPSASIAIPNDSTVRYIGLEYNAGVPQVVSRTAENWNQDTEFALGVAAQVNGTLFAVNNPFRAGDPLTNIIQRFDAQSPAIRDRSVGGLLLGETGTRNVTVSAGKIWHRLDDTDVAAIDTSTTGTFSTGYFDGADWIFSTNTITQWPNEQYNDITTGLVNITGNRYANLWFYLVIDSGVFSMLYGQDEFVNLADALEEAPPSFVPAGWNTNLLLIGRITFREGAVTASQIDSAFTTVFQVTPVNTHNDLSGLQGGTTGEYYHLPSSTYNTLTDLVTGDILYASATDTLSRLPAGSDGEVLTVVSGVPSWEVSSGGSSSGDKNLVIGGNFTSNPWQRGTSFTAPATGAYTADRWGINYVTSAVVNVLKTADSPTVTEAGIYTQHCFDIDITTADATIAAGDFFHVSQKIEGLNSAYLGFGQAGTRDVTLSFWHKHTKTGTYCVSLTNSATNRSYVAEYTQVVTNTWEKAEIVIPVDASGTWLYDTGIGVQVRFALAAGSTFQTTANSWQAGNFLATSNQVNSLDSTSNNFKISLIQLEEGNAATSFEIQSSQSTFLSCCRYYFKATADQNGGVFCFSGYPISATTVALFSEFPVQMRIAPTALETTGTATDYRVVGGGANQTTCSAAPNFNVSTRNGATSVFTVAGGLTAYLAAGGAAVLGSSLAYLAWSAEL